MAVVRVKRAAFAVKESHSRTQAPKRGLNIELIGISVRFPSFGIERTAQYGSADWCETAPKPQWNELCNADYRCVADRFWVIIPVGSVVTKPQDSSDFAYLLTGLRLTQVTLGIIRKPVQR